MTTRHTIGRGWLAACFVTSAALAASGFAGDDPVQPGAGTKADQFRNGIRHRLDAVEGRLKTLKADVQAKSEQSEKSLREDLDAARRKLEAQKEKFEKTRATLKARAEQKLTETEEEVSEWRAKREIRKLNARADQAEAYAASAIDHAAAAIDEAEESILAAMVARLDAEAAQSSAPAPR